MDSYQPEAVRNIALKYPNLRIVVCHLLAPGRKGGDRMKYDLECLSLPNVWFDLAALPYFQMPESWPFPTAQKHIVEAANIVGHKKLIQGTDTPSVLLYEKYGDLINYIREIPDFTNIEKEDILGNNALEAYMIER